MPLLKHKWQRWVIGTIAILVLVATYLFQRYDFSSLAAIESPGLHFIINKSVRFMLNDLACLFLIVAIFNKYSYLRVSAVVFFIELFFLLPLYFFLKLSFEGDSEISSPLLSQMHRMIVNPLLMIILIVGFLYQDYYWKKPDL